MRISDWSSDVCSSDLSASRCRSVRVTRRGIHAPYSFRATVRSEEHTSELQSLMRISYAVFCLKKKITKTSYKDNITQHKQCQHKNSNTITTTNFIHT